MREPSPYSIRILAPHEAVETTASPVFVEQESPLREYWRIIRIHFVLIASVLFCALLLAGIAVFIATPIYTATAELLIEPQPPQVLDIKQLMVEPSNVGEYDYYKTQYALLKSRSLAALVIHSLDLEHNSAFTSRVSRKISPPTSQSELLSSPELPDRNSDLSPQSTEDFGLSPQIVDAYLGSLKIQPEFGTRLVKVSFSSPDPKLSAIVANAHAEAYVRQGMNLRLKANESAQRFLENKLVELRDRVEKSEVALNTYRHDKGLLEFTTKDNNDILLKRLEELNTMFTQAEARRIALEAQVDAIRRGNYDSLPDVVNSASVQALKPELAKLEAEYAGMASRYTDDYAPVAALKARLNDTRRLLNVTIAQIVASTKLEYQTAVARENKFRAAVMTERAHALSLHDSSVQDAILARDVETNRQLYESVLRRMKEIGVAAETQSTNVSTVDHAVPPVVPSSPRKRITLLLAAMLGLGTGVGIAFFLEYIDDTIKTPEDAERYLRLPSLAMVPDVRRASDAALYVWRRGKRDQIVESSSRLVNHVDGAEKAQPSESGAAKLQSWATAVEAYRTLRGRILLSRAGQPPRSILITSALAGEGKTVTAINTATTFAQREKRILLIDADLRRPRCHAVLKLAEGPGLSEVLTGQANFADVIVETEFGIQFIAAGAEPPDPPQLLGSQSMRDFLAGLREEYDHIIIDSAPIMPVSDSLMLSAYADGVVVVANSSTSRQIVKKASDRLASSGAKLLGVILNRISSHPVSYHYYNGCSYNYSYRRRAETTTRERPAIMFS